MYAVSSAVLETIWERGVMAEAGYPQLQPTFLGCDNAGAVAIAKDAASSNRTKHLARRAKMVLHHTERGEVKVQFIRTENQVADILTKPLDRALFVKFRDYLMNTGAQEEEM